MRLKVNGRVGTDAYRPTSKNSVINEVKAQLDCAVDPSVKIPIGIEAPSPPSDFTQQFLKFVFEVGCGADFSSWDEQRLRKATLEDLVTAGATRSQAARLLAKLRSLPS